MFGISRTATYLTFFFVFLGYHGSGTLRGNYFNNVSADNTSAILVLPDDGRRVVDRNVEIKVSSQRARTMVSKKDEEKETMDEAKIKEKWQKADAACFDVDSTVYPHESLDELAEFMGVGERVKQITASGMNDEIGFQQSLKSRLAIMQPTRKLLEDFVQCHNLQLTPGIRPLVSKLKERQVDVFLVSGGLDLLIEPIAAALQIAQENVFCNSLIFDRDGHYLDIDVSRLTARDKGKKLVTGFLKSRYHYECLIMVGDGSNDLDACPPADGFIGFGGNVIRPVVLQKSPWFVYKFTELIAALDSNNCN